MEFLLIGNEYILFFGKRKLLSVFVLKRIKEFKPNCFYYSDNKIPVIRFREPSLKRDRKSFVENARWRFDLNLWERKKWYGYEYKIFSYPSGLKTSRTIFKKKRKQCNYKGVYA